MKKWRNKILSAVLVLSLLLTSSSFAFAVGDGSTESTGEKYTLINDQLTITGVSSYDNEGPESNAVDKTNGSPNTGTFWHTFWDTNHPHDGFTTAQNNHNGYIIVDLKHARYFSQLGFLPRTNGSNDNYQNGRIEKYEVYVSSTYSDVNSKDQLDGTWTMATKGDWNWTGVGKDNVAYRYATLDTPIYTRYVKLQARETYDGHVCASNLNFYEDTTGNANVPTITTQPQSAEYVNASKIQELSVTANNANSYQWYKTEDGTLDSGVIISDASDSTYQPSDFGSYFVKVTSSDGSYVFSNIAEIKSFEAKVNDDYYVSFKDAVSRAPNGSTIEVLKDIEITENIQITDKEITIKSSGEEKYTIIRAESFTNSDMFYVNTNAGKLTLDNIIIDGGAKWTGDKDPVLDRGTTNNGVSTGTTIISIANSAEFNLNAGATLQNGAITSNGGAIYIETGTANVYGKIINNHAGLTGGAIRIQSSGTANIYDGALISGNSAEGEGGVLYSNNVNAVINIHGGNFINNKANDGSVVYNKGTTNIDGAKISGNTATRNGTIYINSGTVNLNGGTITGNTATNGGAVYVNNGTLNLGEANNDYALTISGNTATNGDSIYYGGTGTININAKLKLDGEIYLHTNGMKINQKCDLSGSAPITLVGNRSIEGFITVSNDSYKSSALNVFRVKEGSQAILKPTVISGSDLNVVRNSSMSISNDLGDNLTYYRGIENNLFTVTGSGSITYTWYEKAPDRNEFTEVGENLDLLSDGTHTVYCVATDGTNYMVSDVAEVTVADFVPCSKAIDKFKNI